MQRRAAAVYGVLFLVLALGSYGMIAASSPPTASIDDPDYRQANNSQFTADGQTYAVTVDEAAQTATLEWTVEAADYMEMWANGDEVTFQDMEWEVTIPDEADPSSVHLTEVRTLPDDVETTTVNETEYVVVDRENETREIVPVDEYLNQTQGEAATQQLVEGDTYDDMGNRTTVEAVDNASATLTWTAPRAESEQVSEGDVVELDGQSYVAHFPMPDQVALDGDVQAYEAQLAVVESYHQRVNGLWGVSILSWLALVVLLASAYLPSRY